MYPSESPRNQTPATRTLVPVISALVLTVALVPLGASDDTPVWLQTGRVVSLNEEPVKDAYCTVPVDDLCGFSEADFGSQVAIHKDTLIVGEPNENAIHIYEETLLGWSLSGTFTGPSGFGEDIVVSEDLVVAGARDVAEIHVFTRENKEWNLETIISVEGADCLGRFLAVEGGRIVSGDWCTSTVRVFDPGPAGWTETASLTVPDARFLGRAVAISGDTIIASSLRDGTYEFREEETGWSTSLALEESPGFLTYNGNQIVSAHGGQVLAYEKKQGTWTFSEEITPADASPFGGSQRFAWSIMLGGNTLVVGAPGADASPGSPVQPDTMDDQCVGELGYQVCLPPRPGAAYIFDGSGDGWDQIAKVSGDPVGSHEFGKSVAISGEGEKIAVGAPRNLIKEFGWHLNVDPENSVHVFEPWDSEVV